MEKEEILFGCKKGSTFFMSRLQISAIIVEPEVKEQRRNSSKFSHLELVSKMNEKGGINLLKTGKKH